MPLTDAIEFACRQCGRRIRREARQSGTLVRCSSCETVNRTPGIADQPRATQAQLAEMDAALRRHRLALLVFAPLWTCALALALVTAEIEHRPEVMVFSPVSVLSVLTGVAAVVSAFWLLLAMSTSRSCLGGSRGTMFVLFFLLPAVWLVLAVTTYVRLRRRLAALQAAGARDAED